MTQDTLIYIDDSDRLEAEELARSFADVNIRNRAYINVLGAELALKYLASENINFSDIRNLHSVKKILEEFDISDIILSNIHIDVRVVFDENIIFIPKSHFEYNLVPDIYLIFNLSQDKSNVKFLGFFEPKLINKNNANKDYYFIEKEKLNSPFNLKTFIENYNGNISENLSEDEITNCKKIMLEFSDNDISENNKKYLLSKLIKSLDLRDEFIEFENFETLSYAAMTDTNITKKIVEENISETLETTNDVSDYDENFDEIENIDTIEPTVTGFDNNTFEAFDNEEFDLSDTSETLDEENAEDITEDLNNYEESFIEDNSLLTLDNVNDEPSEEPLEETSDEIMSLDEVQVEEDSLENEEETFQAETINFDNISEINTEDEINEMQDFHEEVISLDEIPEINYDIDNDITEPEELSQIDNLLENVTIDNTETNLEDNDFSQSEIEEDFSNLDLPEISDLEEETEETYNTNIIDENNAEEIQNNVSEEITLEDNTNKIDQQDEDLTNIEEMISEEEIDDNNIETFGKNLLENLALEEDVKIEADEEENDVSEANQEISLETLIDEIPEDSIAVNDDNNIETNDLISQIDDILNTVEELPQEEQSENYDEIDKSTTDFIEIENEEEIEDDKLNLLFSETEINPEGEISELNELGEFADNSNNNTVSNTAIPGAAIVNNNSSQNNKKPLIIAAAFLVIAGGLAFTLFKPKNDTDNAVTNSVELPITPPNTNVNDNTLSQNVPSLEKVSKEENKEIVKPEIKNIPASSESYLSVDRLVWNAPNTLYYSPKFQNYLQTAGKSIKLSLSADLLLVTEYAYTNLIKIDLTLSQNGSVENAKVTSSSGSEEIDKIVLQSVKDTLNVVKPPSGEIKSPNFNLSLNIYL